jgi:LysM repeat protein
MAVGIRKIYLALIVILLPGVLMFGPIAVSASRAEEINLAAQPMTPFPTPTPQASGQIIYIVQQGDSLYRIAGIVGITVEELAALNGMDIDDGVRIGQEMLLGQAGPELPTESPFGSPTPTGIAATPTPIFGTGEICVLVFHDTNGNARIDEGEVPLVGAQISVVDLVGVVAGQHTTDDLAELTVGEIPEGHCFEGIENGEYTVSAAVQPEYNSTTIMNITISLEPGDIKHVEFGAQRSGLSGTSPVESGGDRSTLLGVVGLITLVAAGSLGYYAWNMNRRTPASWR